MRKTYQCRFKFTFCVHISAHIFSVQRGKPLHFLEWLYLMVSCFENIVVIVRSLYWKVKCMLKMARKTHVDVDWSHNKWDKTRQTRRLKEWLNTDWSKDHNMSTFCNRKRQLADDDFWASAAISRHEIFRTSHICTDVALQSIYKALCVCACVCVCEGVCVCLFLCPLKTRERVGSLSLFFHVAPRHPRNSFVHIKFGNRV